VISMHIEYMYTYIDRPRLKMTAIECNGDDVKCNCAVLYWYQLSLIFLKCVVVTTTTTTVYAVCA
jgi:hypothetical protein